MDTYNNSSPNNTSLLILKISIVLVLLVGVAWWLERGGSKAPVAPVQELNDSLTALTATTSVSVPAVSDPLKGATPAVDPLEKTNPFNSTYENPFK